MTRRKLFVWAGITLLESAAFEIIGINGGLYSYWGPHVFRIFQYPLVIGVLEAAQVICFAVAASQLRARCTGQWQLLGLFVLFPFTFFGANFGAGWPTIIAIHLENTSTALVAAATVVSIGFAVVLVRAAAAFLPQRSAGGAEDRAEVSSIKLPQPVPARPVLRRVLRSQSMSPSTTTNIRHAFYILAGAVALVLTWPHAFQWIAAGGNILNPVEFFGDAIAAGGTAAFLSIDMAIAWLVFMVWVVSDSKRIGLGYKWGWAFVALSYIGVSMAFPVYLVTRERYLEKRAPTDELVTH